MSQEQIAGILLCLIGILLHAKPALVWKITESWKTERDSAPSTRYITVLRIVSGTFIGIGILLLVGILK